MIKNKRIMTMIAVLTMLAVCLAPMYSDGSDATDNVLERMYSGSWKWDATTGLGPFNSFYGAFDIENGNRFVSVLDPYDLTKKIDGTALGTGYNIMWIIPTVYWSVDENGDLILSNDPSKGVAYAHTIDGHVYKYIAIGVYEATSDNNSSPTILTSETGKTPLASKTRAQFRSLADAYTMDSSLGENAYSMLWNYYMWELYKYIGLITMEDFNSQTHVGYGHVYTSNSTYAYTTGATDTLGPYAGKIGAWSSSLGNASVKLYLENAWGGVSEWVDGFMMVGGTTIYLDTKHTPTDAITSGTNVESISFSSWPSGYSNAIDTTAKLWGLGINNTGTDSIGLTDQMYKGTSSSGNVLNVGGNAISYASSSLTYGLSFAYANYDPSTSIGSIGGRVAFVFDADPASNAQKIYTYKLDYDATKMTTGSDAITTYDMTSGSPVEMTAISHDAPPTYTVTIASNDTDYGSVSAASVTDIEPGTAITVDGDSLTIGTTTITATPTTSTAQYTYSFDGWYDGSTELQSGTVTQDMTITANFSGTLNLYTVSISAGAGGSVSASAVTSVPYGAVINVSGNVLTVNSVDITAAPNEADAQYTYAFDGWTYDGGSSVTSGTPVEGDVSIIAAFTSTLNEYTITWVIDETSEETTWAYGSMPTHETPTKEDYVFKGWSPKVVAVTGDAAYTATWGEPSDDVLSDLINVIPIIIVAGLLFMILGTALVGRFFGFSVEDTVKLTVGAVISVLIVVVVAIPIFNGL